MACCDGTLLSALRPSLDAEQQQRVDAQIAGYLRQMHEITNPEFGLQSPTAARFGSWSECFATLIEDLLTDRRARNVDIGIDDEAIRSPVEEHRPLLDEVTVARFVHWDLWDSDPVTLEVTGLIDFEPALWADPLMEAQSYAHNGKGKCADDTFVDAYGRTMLVAEDERRRRLLYDRSLCSSSR